MKKIAMIIFALLLSTAIFSKTFAEDELFISTSPSPTPTSTQVQYDLPYPGILPDSPLYFLKVMRDNILGFLISDHSKKAEYELLMADKRLVSAEYLIDEKKGDLAITTLSKSGNYFHQAIQNAGLSKKEGIDATPIIDRLLISSKKHQELISQMIKKSNGKTAASLETLLIRVKGFQKSVENLKSEE